jgi:hypothetical protein
MLRGDLIYLRLQCGLCNCMGSEEKAGEEAR